MKGSEESQLNGDTVNELLGQRLLCQHSVTNHLGGLHDMARSHCSRLRCLSWQTLYQGKKGGVMVSVVLDNIAAGETPDNIATTYRLAKEDVQAALQYAAELARGRIVSLETGAA